MAESRVQSHTADIAPTILPQAVRTDCFVAEICGLFRFGDDKWPDFQAVEQIELRHS